SDLDGVRPILASPIIGRSRRSDPAADVGARRARRVPRLRPPPPHYPRPGPRQSRPRVGKDCSGSDGDGGLISPSPSPSPKGAGEVRWAALPRVRTLDSDSDLLLRYQLVRRIERRNLVALSESRVVEDRAKEVVEAATQPDHGVTDVEELGRPG